MTSTPPPFDPRRDGWVDTTTHVVNAITYVNAYGQSVPRPVRAV